MAVPLIVVERYSQDYHNYSYLLTGNHSKLHGNPSNSCQDISVLSVGPMEDIPSSTAVVKQCEYKERRENKSYMPARTRWTAFPEASELSF